MAHKTKKGRLIIAIEVLILLVLFVATGLVTWKITKDSFESEKSPKTDKITNQEFHIGNLILTDSLHLSLKRTDKVLLSGQLFYGEVLNSSETCTSTSGDICMEWENDRKLTVSYGRFQNVDCYNVSWEAQRCREQELLDCYELGDSHWYGGYEDFYQPWPLEKTSRNMSVFLTFDSYQKQIGGVQERYFITTNGVCITIDDNVPLYVSINASDSREICFLAKYDKYPYINPRGKLPILKYQICTAPNVKSIHDFMSDKLFKKPQIIPDEMLFRHPIWSTWAQYHKDINQSIVMQFAEDILRNNFSHSQLEIDDDWTPHYGDMDFNKEKFPEAKKMIQDLNGLGFRVTVWLHPFFNIDSNAFSFCALKGYLIRQYDSQLPALVSWWDGKGAGILDVSNEEAVEWYLNRTSYLRQVYNVSSFKFDAGEAGWLPNIYSPRDINYNPNFYPTKWAELAYESDKDIRHQEVRVGYHTQHLPIFVRMLDKDSNWDYANGLKSLIPTALTFGILGYPFILPDMIGGNAYNRKPEAELFIRWLQATVFMPSLQFSIVPWQYNDTIINISKEFVSLHETFSDIFISLATESIQTGDPIVRPLWWIAPEDKAAQLIDSEFLVGDSILVAPVLDQGATQRDIYLPAGQWTDQLRNDVKAGGMWYRNYKANLDELPYFIRKGISYT